MKDYSCGVYFVDTEDNFAEFIPIIDNEGIIDDSYITKENEREKRIEDFVDKLKNTKSVSLDFLANVENALKQNVLSDDLKKTVEELLEC
jgi:crotonobetainyl-CoA:carnitine CoA-transferase CaiB-like acyl-CoA transferase